jgi:hypothetical protein
MSYNLWELSKKQAKEFELKYLKLFFEDKKFKLRKGGGADFDFIRKNPIGNEVVYFTHLESFPGTQQEFYILKEINEIELHYEAIIKGLGQNYNKHKYPRSLKFWKGSIEGINTNRYMPQMLTEMDVASSCEIVKNFMTETGFPMLERFNDIKELNKEINGESFWTTDWQMPFDLGGDFDIKRIIIARLANQGNFEKVMQKSYEQIDKWLTENNQPPIDRTDITKGTPFIEHYLKNLKI